MAVKDTSVPSRNYSIRICTSLQALSTNSTVGTARSYIYQPWLTQLSASCWQAVGRVSFPLCIHFAIQYVVDDTRSITYDERADAIVLIDSEVPHALATSISNLTTRERKAERRVEQRSGVMMVAKIGWVLCLAAWLLDLSHLLHQP